MDTVHYIGFDVHKKMIAICVKGVDGKILEEETIASRREDLGAWISRHKTPWIGALEATLFTGWIYDVLKPAAKQLKVGHPLMLKAITASKKKNDRIDARKLADLVRTDFLPESYVAPQQWRDLRRLLRYRNLVLRQTVRLKNRIAGLLMETGTEYCKEKLHRRGYFEDLVTSLDKDEYVPSSVVNLLRISRTLMVTFSEVQGRLVRELVRHPDLRERVERLMTIPGVGQITALTWALETAEVHRFPSIGRACSYCGLTSALNSSAGKDTRGPISKQRNSYLQSTLIEAAKLAPQFNPALALVYEQERQQGHANRATLEVARKLVAFLMAVDKSKKNFELRMPAGASTDPPSPQHEVPAPR